MNPTISIAIPCYRSERYIRTTIESALAQRVAPCEVLISDDNSPDRSFEIIKEYEEIPQVRIVRPAHRLELGEHYRFLLERAKGDYVCFLSSDDALMPSFVQTMHAVIRREPQIGMVAAGCLECNASMVPQRVRGMGLPNHTLPAPDGFSHFAKGCTYTISTSILSRRLLLESRPLPAGASLPTDWYWALVIGLNAKVGFLREPLGYYRFHETNASHSAAQRWREEAHEMLRFLIVSTDLGAARQRELLETLRELGISTATAPEKKPPVKWSVRVKNLMKEVMVLPYRRGMPSFLMMAERGISVALARQGPTPPPLSN
jgi:hypothetical protein